VAGGWGDSRGPGWRSARRARGTRPWLGRCTDVVVPLAASPRRPNRQEIRRADVTSGPCAPSPSVGPALEPMDCSQLTGSRSSGPPMGGVPCSASVWVSAGLRCQFARRADRLPLAPHPAASAVRRRSRRLRGSVASLAVSGWLVLAPLPARGGVGRKLPGRGRGPQLPQQHSPDRTFWTVPLGLAPSVGDGRRRSRGPAAAGTAGAWRRADTDRLGADPVTQAGRPPAAPVTRPMRVTTPLGQARGRQAGCRRGLGQDGAPPTDATSARGRGAGRRAPCPNRWRMS